MQEQMNALLEEQNQETQTLHRARMDNLATKLAANIKAAVQQTKLEQAGSAIDVSVWSHSQPSSVLLYVQQIRPWDFDC